MKIANAIFYAPLTFYSFTINVTQSETRNRTMVTLYN
jgi:hypothetical protein